MPAGTAPSSPGNTGSAASRCPIAVVNGEDPALFIAGFEYLPEGQSEYEFAGAIKGAPIEICPGPQTGLPIPAPAEIVFEGQLLPMSETSLPEGPFGEFTGYYAVGGAAGAGDGGRPAPTTATIRSCWDRRR